MKNTAEWKGLKITVMLTIQNRQAKVSVVPSASSLLIKALKEPPRDRKKVKNSKCLPNPSPQNKVGQWIFLDWSRYLNFEVLEIDAQIGQNQRRKWGCNSLRYCCTLIIISYKQYNIVIIMTTVLTLYQTTNFRLFQTERVCRRQFQI